MTLGRKTGGGSRLGKPNKHPKAFRDQLRAYCQSINVDPFRFLADCIADEKMVAIGMDDQGKRVMAPAVSMQLKVLCAKELCQYLEPKQRALTVAGDSDSPINFQYTLKITLAQAFERAYGLPANQQNGQATALPPGLPVVPVAPMRRP
jgi:hypothetical protein